MLEGLEVSEISYKKSVLTDNETFRFDSEYFQKELLVNIEKLKKLPTQKLEDFAYVKGGKRLPLDDDFVDAGVRYIRAEDVKNSFVQYKNSPFISENTHLGISAYQTIKDDVLLTIVGNSIGDVGIVKFELDRCNLTENCVKVVPKFAETSNVSDYLFLFFMSHYGQTQILRERVGTAQPKLAIERIRRFLIPVVSVAFQNALSDILLTSNSLLLKQDEVYKQAEQSLLEAVGLAEFKPSTQNTNIKTFVQSFGTSGRLDAEYYQPKYEEVMAQIISQTHVKLLDVVTIKKSIEPGSDAYADEGLPFIRVSDFSKTGLTTPDKCLSSEYYEANQKKLNSLKPKQNTILFSKDGSVGAAYLLREDLHGVTSGAILHLSLKRDDVLPEYLTLVLNSKLVQMQAERDAGGSIILHWRVGEIENVVLPIIALAAQTKISELVQQSFILKAQSEHLLSVAKRAVEIAIEQDEVAAMHFIENIQ